MPRLNNSHNIHYNYILTIDDKPEKIRTRKCLADKLNVSLSTIQNFLNKRTKSIRKYKDVNITIEKFKSPIFELKKIEY